MGTVTLVIFAPIEVDELMRQVPKGKLLAINEIRAALAKKHGATIGCPLTTGIFALITARAAEEQKQQGTIDIALYWRTLKAGGFLKLEVPRRSRISKSASIAGRTHSIEKSKKHFVVGYLKAVTTLDE
jgi:hypothetical protein